MLERAQTTSNENEICSARHLNVLLDDLRKFIGKKTVSSSPLSEEVLLQINVTTKTHQGNLGLLKNGGTFAWPEELKLPGLVSPQECADIEGTARALVQQALDGQVGRKDVDKLRHLLSVTGQKLTTKWLREEITAGQYLNAKRFLTGLETAGAALESGDAVPYFRFREWIGRGRTIQEVADYLLQEGLQFAPAIAGGERAYRIVHSALAAYDIELNQLTSSLAAMRNRP
jgi:hypothetical protein